MDGGAGVREGMTVGGNCGGGECNGHDSSSRAVRCSSRAGASAGQLCSQTLASIRCCCRG